MAEHRFCGKDVRACQIRHALAINERVLRGREGEMRKEGAGMEGRGLAIYLL